MNLPKIQNSGFSGVHGSNNKYDPSRTTFGDDAQGESAFSNDPDLAGLTTEHKLQLIKAARNGKAGMVTNYMQRLFNRYADPIRNTVLRLQNEGHLAKYDSRR